MVCYSKRRTPACMSALGAEHSRWGRSQNTQCGNAVRSYQGHLKSEDPNESGFQTVTLEDCIDTLDAVGAGEVATKLRGRYLDFSLIDRVVSGE